MDNRAFPTAIVAAFLCVAFPSEGASHSNPQGNPGPAIIGVIEDIQDADGSACPMGLTVRRFVLGDPAEYLGERISVCVAEATPVFTLRFGNRAELDFSELQQGDLIRFWPEEVMRPTNPISMRAESVELLENSGCNPGGWDGR